jgi:hypothetical protein
MMMDFEDRRAKRAFRIIQQEARAVGFDAGSVLARRPRDAQTGMVRSSAMRRLWRETDLTAGEIGSILGIGGEAVFEVLRRLDRPLRKPCRLEQTAETHER